MTNIEKKKKQLAEKKKKREEYDKDRGGRKWGADGLPDLKYEIEQGRKRLTGQTNLVHHS